MHFPVITDPSGGTRSQEHVCRESQEQPVWTYIEHLLRPVLAGAGDTNGGSAQGGQRVADTAETGDPGGGVVMQADTKRDGTQRSEAFLVPGLTQS